MWCAIVNYVDMYVGGHESRTEKELARPVYGLSFETHHPIDHIWAVYGQIVRYFKVFCGCRLGKHNSNFIKLHHELLSE